MPLESFLKCQVTIIRNPSLIVERTLITLKNEQFPDIYELFINVRKRILCSIIIHAARNFSNNQSQLNEN